jgi:hypothetical protein
VTLPAESVAESSLDVELYARVMVRVDELVQTVHELALDGQLPEPGVPAVAVRVSPAASATWESFFEELKV